LLPRVKDVNILTNNCCLSLRQVLQDVTADEFLMFMTILSGLKCMQTLVGRQHLVDIISQQAGFDSDFEVLQDCYFYLSFWLGCSKVLFEFLPFSFYNNLFHLIKMIAYYAAGSKLFSFSTNHSVLFSHHSHSFTL